MTLLCRGNLHDEDDEADDDGGAAGESKDVY